MNRSLPLALLVLACASSHAAAFEFRCRFVERIGAIDVVLPDSPLGPGNYIDASDGLAHRIRIQFGVFDDGAGPAPAGGFVGWNAGMLCVDGCMGMPVPPPSNSDDSIVGRLAPFTFAPGGPSGPFECQTDIDATLGTQSPIWNCGPGGVPLPQPAPVVRGINSYVSVLEFIVDPNPGFVPYTVLANGNLIAATQWLVVGSPTPPDCSDPSNPIPGSVTYAPFPTPPQAFECHLFVNCVPTPGSAGILALSALTLRRRRR
jgi:hypothetical protein